MAKKGWSPLHGIICLWSGVIVDIPDGWVLCDGTNGTPDLRQRFVIGAGPVLTPHDTGGAWEHTHAAITYANTDSLADGTDIVETEGAEDYSMETTGHNHVTAIYNTTMVPPYYALCYIMKL